MLDVGRLSQMARDALAMREQLSFDRHIEQMEQVYVRVLNSRQKQAGGVTR